ncbi:MAG: ABC transporter substrate-binding protein, partial [Myxococcota bacterium]
DWLYEPEFQPRVGIREVTSDLGVLAGEGLSTRFRQVAYEVVMERPMLMVVLKLFLPLAIIALVALVALFLPADMVQPRSSIGVTALLSCFAFHFSVADKLPQVAYLTMADLLFLVAYFMSALALFDTVLSFSLSRAGRPRTATWLDRVVRIMLPVATAVAVWQVLPAAPPDPAPVSEPVPEMARTASSRDVLRIGTSALSSTTSSTVNRGVSWGLMPELGGEPAPVYVERVPGVDNDAMRFLASGELEVTWRVRPNVRWSDGTPLRAADIALPWQALATDHVVSADVLDDRTLVVRWDSRLARALAQPTPWPAAILRPIYDEGGYEALRRHRRQNALPSFGPYRMVEFAAKKRAVVESNPSFIGPAPAIARVEERYFADRKQLIAAFLAGEIDIIVPNSVTLAQAREVAESRPQAVVIRPSAVLVMLSPDLSHPLLGRLEVRRAMLQAIDRRRLARVMYGDAGRVAHLPVPDGAPPAAGIIDYDPEAASEALAAAGAEGARLPLFHNSSPTDRRIARLVANYLNRAGLDIELSERDSVSALYRPKTHGGLILYAMRGTRDASPRRYWNLPIVDGAYPPDARHDAYSDEVHAVVEREMRALYPERREQLRDALFAMVAQRLPNLTLVFAAERILVDPALQGWDRGVEIPFGTGLESWYFAD